MIFLLPCIRKILGNHHATIQTSDFSTKQLPHHRPILLPQWPDRHPLIYQIFPDPEPLHFFFQNIDSFCFFFSLQVLEYTHAGDFHMFDLARASLTCFRFEAFGLWQRDGEVLHICRSSLSLVRSLTNGYKQTSRATRFFFSIPILLFFFFYIFLQRADDFVITAHTSLGLSTIDTLCQNSCDALFF